MQTHSIATWQHRSSAQYSIAASASPLDHVLSLSRQQRRSHIPQQGAAGRSAGHWVASLAGPLVVIPPPCHQSLNATPSDPRQRAGSQNQPRGSPTLRQTGLPGFAHSARRVMSGSLVT